jgi:hypothetical protein
MINSLEMPVGTCDEEAENSGEEAAAWNDDDGDGVAENCSGDVVDVSDEDEAADTVELRSVCESVVCVGDAWEAGAELASRTTEDCDATAGRELSIMSLEKPVGPRDEEADNSGDDSPAPAVDVEADTSGDDSPAPVVDEEDGATDEDAEEVDVEDGATDEDAEEVDVRGAADDDDGGLLSD